MIWVDGTPAAPVDALMGISEPQTRVGLCCKHLDPRAHVDLEPFWYFAPTKVVCLEVALEFSLQIGQHDLVGLCTVNPVLDRYHY